MTEQEPTKQEPCPADPVERYRQIVNSPILLRQDLNDIVSRKNIFLEKEKGSFNFPEGVLQLGKAQLENLYKQQQLGVEKKMLGNKLLEVLTDKERLLAFDILGLVKDKILPATAYDIALLDLVGRHTGKKGVRIDSEENPPELGSKSKDTAPANGVVFQKPVQEHTTSPVAKEVSSDGASKRDNDRVQKNEDHKEVKVGEKIIKFSLKADIQVKVLEILACTKEPMSVGMITRALFGKKEDFDKNFSEYRNKTASALYMLPGTLRSSDILVGKKAPENQSGKKNWKTERCFYYLTEKDGKPLINNLTVHEEPKATPAPVVEKCKTNPVPLNNEEIFIVTKRLLKCVVRDKVQMISVGINTDPIMKSEEMKEFIHRINGELDKKINNNQGLERRSIEGAIEKFRFFAKNPKDYYKSCSKIARVLLKCFNPEKMEDGMWEKLLPAETIIYAKKDIVNTIPLPRHLREVGTE